MDLCFLFLLLGYFLFVLSGANVLDLFFLSYCILVLCYSLEVCFLMRHREGLDLDKSVYCDEVGGVERGGTIIRICENIHFN